MKLSQLHEVKKSIWAENEDGDVILDNLKLDKLPAGAPDKVSGNFDCHDNQLMSLVGCSPHVGGNIYCGWNKFTNFKDIHLHVKSMNGGFWAFNNPVKSHILGFLYIKGCQRIGMDNLDESLHAIKILNKYLPNTFGHKAVIDCQSELLDAGLEDFAQL